MSADMVDNLHYAEDRVGLLETRLKEAQEWVDSDHPLWFHIASALSDTYCRPSCAWLWEGECQDEDGEDNCGCPCGHGEEE